MELDFALTPLAELEAAVTNGALRLDLYCPGWRERVDADHIEADCMLHSVTGQVFGPDLFDQMVGVGISPETVPDVFAATALFSEHGYGVFKSVPKPIPEPVLEMMREAARRTAEAVGLPEPDFSNMPTVVPVPRDLDVVDQEVAALTYLWEKEVKRRG